jgi:hypothetical protein
MHQLGPEQGQALTKSAPDSCKQSQKSTYFKKKLPHFSVYKTKNNSKKIFGQLHVFDTTTSTLHSNRVNIKTINLSQKIDFNSLEETETFVVQIWANLCTCYCNDCYRIIRSECIGFCCETGRSFIAGEVLLSLAVG